MKWREERAGYAAGTGPVPDEELAVRVGGPLSVLRLEAADLLQRLARSSENTNPLLVFIDNLVLLDKSGGKQFLTPDSETSSTSMILVVL